MLNLGKVFGDKRGLDYVDKKTIPSPSKRIFMKANPPRVNMHKVAKASSKQSKTRGKSIHALANHPKSRQPLKKRHAFEKDFTSLNKI
ncbi:hypothetical protein ACOSP7_021172 [Xanthoceras sorbifolium]